MCEGGVACRIRRNLIIVFPPGTHPGKLVASSPTAGVGDDVAKLAIFDGDPLGAEEEAISYSGIEVIQ